MPKSQESNVVRVRIIVLDDFQPARDAGVEPVEGSDPNGQQVLEQLLQQASRKSSLADLKTRIAAAALKVEPKLMPHDIVAVGHHPFSVIGGTLVGHHDAEHKGAVVRLSLLRQDVLIWESDRPFAVIVRPVEKAPGHVGDHEPAPEERHVAAVGPRPAASVPSHPFHRKDHPFVALRPGDREPGGVYRVSAGAVRPDALIQRHYKATVLIGSQRLDPDLIISL
jgi:hypothetical protein